MPIERDMDVAGEQIPRHQAQASPFGPATTLAQDAPPIGDVNGAAEPRGTTANGPTGGLGAGESRYFNRELSLLEFGRRVLTLAGSPDQPLLERAKFLAIFSGQLDEFFQVRVAGLKDQLAAGLPGTAPDGLPVPEQLRAIRSVLEELLAQRARTYHDSLVPELAAHGIRLVPWGSLGAADMAYAESVFEAQIFPVLTPLGVDPGHPFPYISNLSLNLAVMVRDPQRSERRFARVKVPPVLPGFLPLPDGERFVPIDQVIAAFLGELFPGMEIESCHSFRVIRNADLTLAEDEADDLLEAVEMELRRRRFGRAVCLQLEAGFEPTVRDLLARELDLRPEDVYEVDGLLDYGGLWALHSLERPELKDEPFLPVTPARLAALDGEEVDVFSGIASGDIFVHHPYESFAMSTEAFIKYAATDPHVLAIKQTLYRTSGDSPVVTALIRAAERGKQVAALVELKARGDELANIGWARALEQVGVHVVYGLIGLKTHAKTALVVRQEREGIRRYCHIGTGNYNSSTARVYEDIGILTASPALGEDLTDLFNFLTGYSRQDSYRQLVVAPLALRSKIIELIERECTYGGTGRIVWKVNNLVDRRVIDALYSASQSGVQVDLVVRAMCSLRPGVPGLSENIRVRSLVGRYLEHSRIFYFSGGSGAPAGYAFGRAAAPIRLRSAASPAPGKDTPLPRASWPGLPDGGCYLLGSADIMERNLDRRVEALIDVKSPEIQDRLREILEVVLADDELAWELSADGSWRKLPLVKHFNAQRHFQELAISRARRR
ncbi:MAG TPA: polyphosphate kinase 1, partial [Acidimicrobiales bacterium]|nr:polyphosphate kinase 1 [Acidimicrobiales bacterium]